ncbi:MAG: ferritin family protein [Bacteroidales bacterium]|nr:ferritin family protein [Bacteroidales bacterium]
MENNKALEILKTAILMEKRGKAFYEKMAEQTQSPEARKIFSIMAEEEKTHVEFLSVQFSHYIKEHSFLKPDKSIAQEDVAHEILNADLVKQISAASFEAAAISAAMDFETRAVEVYSKRAAETEDPNEKELYLWLAEWESGHHKILHDLNEQLKEDIWFDNQFWPF